MVQAERVGGKDEERCGLQGVSFGQVVACVFEKFYFIKNMGILIIILVLTLIGITAYLIFKSKREQEPEEKKTEHPDSFFHKDRTYSEREREEREKAFFKRKGD